MRLIAMRNGRETTLTLIVAYYDLIQIMVFILRDQVAYDIRLLRPIVMRHGRDRGRGRKEKIAYHVTLNLSRCRE